MSYESMISELLPMVTELSNRLPITSYKYKELDRRPRRPIAEQGEYVYINKKYGEGMYCSKVLRVTACTRFYLVYTGENTLNTMYVDVFRIHLTPAEAIDRLTSVNSYGWDY